MTTRAVSMRWDESVLERLRRRAQLAGWSSSALAQRYVDESLRMAEHPGIGFRDGPAGRRAGLVAGPDVWEVVAVLRGIEERGDDAIAATAESTGLTVGQVRVAVRYYAAFRDEVELLIDENHRAADAAHRTWQAEQQLLA